MIEWFSHHIQSKFAYLSSGVFGISDTEVALHKPAGDFAGDASMSFLVRSNNSAAKIHSHLCQRSKAESNETMIVL